jgi:hypothetical protein
MSRTLAPAGIAHYDPRLAKPSTLPAPHGRTCPGNRTMWITEPTMMFLDCPAYLDRGGAVRWGLPAEVKCQFTTRSTDGPIECAMIRCPAGHWFNGAIESLTWDSTRHHDPGTSGLGSRAGRDGLQRRHGGRDGDGGSALRPGSRLSAPGHGTPVAAVHSSMPLD